MKTLKEEIEENSEYNTYDCGCCGGYTIDTDTLFTILKGRGIEVEK